MTIMCCFTTLLMQQFSWWCFNFFCLIANLVLLYFQRVPLLLLYHFPQISFDREGRHKNLPVDEIRTLHPPTLHLLGGSTLHPPITTRGPRVPRFLNYNYKSYKRNYFRWKPLFTYENRFCKLRMWNIKRKLYRKKLETCERNTSHKVQC